MAGVRDSGPAVAAQRGGDERGAVANALGDAHGAEPEGLHGVRREVEVVAVPVRRGAVALVVSRPVNLDGHPVLGVPVVLVVRSAAKLPAGLALRVRQAVRALDVSDVAAFQRGVDTVTGVLERLGQPRPPPDATAALERLAERGDGDEVLRDRAGDPRVPPFVGRGGRDEV